MAVKYFERIGEHVMQPRLLDVSVGGVTAAVLASLLVHVETVHAEEKVLPAFLTMSETLIYEDNLTKQSTNKVKDGVSVTAVKGGFDKTYGRQHYGLNGTVAQNIYKNTKRLNNSSYRVDGNFSTEMGADFLISLDGGLNHELSKFEDYNTGDSVKNLIDSKSFGADVRYGLNGRMSVNLGGDYSSIKFSAPAIVGENRSAKTLNLGWRYMPSDLVYYGVGYARVETEYPKREVEYTDKSGAPLPDRVGESVSRDSLNLSVNWAATGFSLLSASLGYSSEKYKYDWRRDFHGLTGAAAWRFSPQGKMSYTFLWRRDTNNSGGLTSSTEGSASLYNTANKVSNTYQASANFAATSKIGLNASLSYTGYQEERELVLTGVPRAGSSEASTTSRYVTYTFGVNYSPVDAIALGCNAQRYDRTASITVNRAYKGNTISCTAGFTLQ